MEAAPYHLDLAEAPPQTRAVWAQASDGLNIRIALTPAEGAKGTILIFPGRTEVVEKYGRVSARLANAGWASASIDWRGQGLADRMLDDPSIGHVEKFPDYQMDVAAYEQIVRAQLPGPYMLLGHSMGGAIGLRALLQGIDVRAAAFSAPMWGIAMPPLQKPFNHALSFLMQKTGFGAQRAPTTPVEAYVLESPFEGNTLTGDPADWDYMKRQLEAVPGLRLGGPSIHWLREAIAECRWLLSRTPRDLPILTGMGSNEAIVSKSAIRQRMSLWPRGEFLEIAGAQHELLMELPEIRDLFEAQMLRLFDSNLDNV